MSLETASNGTSLPAAPLKQASADTNSNSSILDSKSAHPSSSAAEISNGVDTATSSAKSSPTTSTTSTLHSSSIADSSKSHRGGHTNGYNGYSRSKHHNNRQYQNAAYNHNPYATNGYYYPTYYDPNAYYGIAQNPKNWQNGNQWSSPGGQPPSQMQSNGVGVAPFIPGQVNKSFQHYQPAEFIQSNGIHDGDHSHNTSQDEDDDIEVVMNQGSTGQTSNHAAGGRNDLSPEQLREALKKQLQFYFSRENLANDAYLVSQMSHDLYVPISTIARFNMVKNLTDSQELVTSVLKDCDNVIVDDAGQRVRPNISLQRTTLILRDIPEDVTKEDILDIFADPQARKVKDAKPDIGNIWYVTFETEDDTVKMLFFIRSKTLRGKPLAGRIKSENILKSIYDPDATTPEQAAAAAPALNGQGQHPYMDTSAYGAMAPQYPQQFYPPYGYMMPPNGWNMPPRQYRGSKGERGAYKSLPSPGEASDATAVDKNGDEQSIASVTDAATTVVGAQATEEKAVITETTGVTSPKSRSSGRNDGRPSNAGDANTDKARSDGRRKSKSGPSGGAAGAKSQTTDNKRFDGARRRSTPNQQRSKSKGRDGDKKGRAKSLDRAVPKVPAPGPAPKMGVDNFPPLGPKGKAEAVSAIADSTGAKEIQETKESPAPVTETPAIPKPAGPAGGWSNIAQSLGKIKPEDHAFKPIPKKQSDKGEEVVGEAFTLEETPKKKESRSPSTGKKSRATSVTKASPAPAPAATPTTPAKPDVDLTVKNPNPGFSYAAAIRTLNSPSPQSTPVTQSTSASVSPPPGKLPEAAMATGQRRPEAGETTTVIKDTQ